MKPIIALALAAALSQGAGNVYDAHVMRAKIAAGDAYNLFDFLCMSQAPRVASRANDRSTWYAGLNADHDSLDKYIASARRFDGIVQQAEAT